MRLLGVVSRHAHGEVATVYLAETQDGHYVEFVDQAAPPPGHPQGRIISVSSLLGCPVRCKVCDAGGQYEGRLTAAEILSQIDHAVSARYADGVVPELRELPKAFRAEEVRVALATMVPAERDEFFEALIDVKDKHYRGGRFDLRYSMYTTDEWTRRTLVPVRGWGFDLMAAYGWRFHSPGDQKITLDFATPHGLPLEPERLRQIFSPERFRIRLSPLHATQASREAGLTSLLSRDDVPAARTLARRFAASSYQVALELGDRRVEELGAACGQLASGPRKDPPRPRRRK
jgi:23S rRNA (adenine2503-C2)-methyltransferase